MSGHSQGRDDTLVNAAMLRKSVSKILKRIRLDRRHDIPYLAGYSINGSTIYIDRHLPKSFCEKNGRRQEIDRFLILHEATEKALIDQLGISYQHAHQIALRAEEAAVRAAGASWREYDRFMKQGIKRADSEKIMRVPADLDLTPYRDEKDLALIEVMRKAGAKG